MSSVLYTGFLVLKAVLVTPPPRRKADERHMPAPSCDEELVGHVAHLRLTKSTDKVVTPCEGVDVEQHAQRCLHTGVKRKYSVEFAKCSLSQKETH